LSGWRKRRHAEMGGRDSTHGKGEKLFIARPSRRMSQSNRKKKLSVTERHRKGAEKARKKKHFGARLAKSIQ